MAVRAQQPSVAATPIASSLGTKALGGKRKRRASRPNPSATGPPPAVDENAPTAPLPGLAASTEARPSRHQGDTSCSRQDPRLVQRVQDLARGGRSLAEIDAALSAEGFTNSAGKPWPRMSDGKVLVRICSNSGIPVPPKSTPAVPASAPPPVPASACPPGPTICELDDSDDDE